MKVDKYFVVLLVCTLLLGWVTITRADQPTPTPYPLPGKGSTGPLQIVPGEATLNSATDNVIYLDLPKVYHQSVARDLTSRDVGATAFIQEKFENFEGAFPNNWDTSGSTHTWTDVPCFALDGFWSGYPAGLDGPNGIDPCAPNALYPNDVSSWLVYGPFSLQNATFAFFDFYYRIESELCSPITFCDFLFRGASIDGNTFYGDFFSGTQITGPYNNGYSASLFDLDNVPTLGNLMGQPQVWVGFRFRSDFSVQFRGPFIDNVFVGIYTQDFFQTYLPVILNSPPPTIPKTNLYVRNEALGTATYIVKQAKVDGVVVGDRSCNIPLNQTVFCATFDAGPYNVQSLSSCPGGGGQGTRTFPPGDITVTLTCKP
jgi:hypothetical protein